MHANEPDPAWLLDDDGKPWSPLEEMTREQVLAELTFLRGKTPGIGGPLLLIVIGGLTFFTGVGFTIGGIVSTLVSTAISWALYVGLGGIVLGVVLVVAGVIRFGQIARSSTRYQYRIEQLEHRLETLDQMVEHSAQRMAPAAMFELARF